MAMLTRGEEKKDNMAKGAGDSQEDTTLARRDSGAGGITKPPAGRVMGGGGAGRFAGQEDGFFTIHKKGQGYWTRMGTAAAALLIGALTANFLYQQRSNFHLGNHPAMVMVAVFCVAYAILAFYLINRATNAEFLIATDSEMKKVNWTSKKELTGSTQVVILFMFFMAAFLFVCDLFFIWLFRLLGVLKAGI